MTAATYDFTIEQYATLRESFTVTDPQNAAALVDLSVGFSANFQIRDVAGKVLADLSTVNGGVVLGVGSIELFLDATATGALLFTKAKHDLLITNTATGDVNRYFQGNVKLSMGVTHA